MTDAAAIPDQNPAKSKKKTVILALTLALAGAGGGYFSVVEGLIPLGAPHDENMKSDTITGGDVSESSEIRDEKMGLERNSVPMGEIAFIEVDPITISLNAAQSVQHLRFRAQLEVNSEFEREVIQILPRVTDVFNNYLRALELDDLTGPLALIRLRAQMLRRVQVVSGKGRVRDLLIMEFVLN